METFESGDNFFIEILHIRQRVGLRKRTNIIHRAKLLYLVDLKSILVKIMPILFVRLSLFVVVSILIYEFYGKPKPTSMYFVDRRCHIAGPVDCRLRFICCRWKIFGRKLPISL